MARAADIESSLLTQLRRAALHRVSLLMLIIYSIPPVPATPVLPCSRYPSSQVYEMVGQDGEVDKLGPLYINGAARLSTETSLVSHCRLTVTPSKVVTPLSFITSAVLVVYLFVVFPLSIPHHLATFPHLRRLSLAPTSSPSWVRSSFPSPFERRRRLFRQADRLRDLVPFSVEFKGMKLTHSCLEVGETWIQPPPRCPCSSSPKSALTTTDADDVKKRIEHDVLSTHPGSQYNAYRTCYHHHHPPPHHHHHHPTHRDTLPLSLVLAYNSRLSFCHCVRKLLLVPR